MILYSMLFTALMSYGNNPGFTLPPAASPAPPVQPVASPPLPQQCVDFFQNLLMTCNRSIASSSDAYRSYQRGEKSRKDALISLSACLKQCSPDIDVQSAKCGPSNDEIQTQSRNLFHSKKRCGTEGINEKPVNLADRDNVTDIQQGVYRDGFETFTSSMNSQMCSTLSNGIKFCRSTYRADSGVGHDDYYIGLDGQNYSSYTQAELTLPERPVVVVPPAPPPRDDKINDGDKPRDIVDGGGTRIADAPGGSSSAGTTTSSPPASPQPFSLGGGSAGGGNGGSSGGVSNSGGSNGSYIAGSGDSYGTNGSGDGNGTGSSSEVVGSSDALATGEVSSEGTSASVGTSGPLSTASSLGTAGGNFNPGSTNLNLSDSSGGSGVAIPNPGPLRQGASVTAASPLQKVQNFFGFQKQGVNPQKVKPGKQKNMQTHLPGLKCKKGDVDCYVQMSLKNRFKKQKGGLRLPADIGKGTEDILSKMARFHDYHMKIDHEGLLDK